MADPIREYLIRLGFTESDSLPFSKFDSLLARAEVSVTRHTSGIAKTFLETGGAIVGAFTGISGAILGVIENAAAMDLQWKLSGEKMMMSTESARKYDLITKTLGADLGQIWRDPELHGRANELGTFIDRVFGPANDPKLKRIRDMQFAIKELTGPGLMALGQKFTISLMEQLFPGEDPLKKLQGWVTYFEEHSDEISTKLATNVVPILKETWHIMLDMGEAAKATGLAFTRMVGLLTGDKKLAESKGGFEDFATAIQHVTNAFKSMVDIFTGGMKFVAHGMAAISMYASGDTEGAKKELMLALYGEPPKTKPGEVKPLTGIVPKATAFVEKYGGALAAGPWKNVLPSERAANMEAIIAAAQKYGVPPSLALAVAAQESGFQQSRKSSKGAIGVMQLMGPTAKDLGVNPNIASENIEGGVHYLSNLLKWYQGDQTKAVAAYNAGIRRVDSGRALPPETQAYVPSVMARAQAYLRNQSAGVAASSGSGGPSQQTVNVGGVYLTQPGSTPEQVQRAVADGVREGLNNQVQNDLAQMQPAY